jgi:hypothetical protein
MSRPTANAPQLPGTIPSNASSICYDTKLVLLLALSAYTLQPPRLLILAVE